MLRPIDKNVQRPKANRNGFPQLSHNAQHSMNSMSARSLQKVTLCVVLCITSGSIAQTTPTGTASSPPALVWEGDLGHRFLAAKGRRGFLFTIGAEGVEGYIYPFRVFHDLRVSFFKKDSDAPIEAHAIAQRVSVTPTRVTRFYASDGLRVRETLFVPTEEAALLVLYEVESSEPVNIRVTFRPDLDLMWPAGIGGQSYGWDKANHAFQIEEPSGTYHARIGSPDAASHSDPMDRSEPWKTDRALAFEVRALPHTVVPVIATIGMPKSYDAVRLYAQALEEYRAWQRQAEEHYGDLSRQLLQIETGDAQTDQALAWASIALDQAYACNPDLGCGMVAGYGPTWPTRRPQYAWFFAGDALVTTWALEAENAHDEVAEELKFIRKYQNSETGAMWHEISQSAMYVDWFHRYPFIYRHTDISPLYLLAMRNIWRASGDHDLLQTSWPSLEAAWHFCLAHLDPRDGLLIIPPDQSGVNENEADRTEKELPLEMVWAAGADAFAELAAAAGKPSLSDEAHQASMKAKASLTEFWDPTHSYYFEGLRAGGRPLTQQMASPAWGIWQKLLPSPQREMVLDHLAQPAFQTAWGLRSIASDDPNYQPDSYAHGSVWPLTTSFYILATLVAHRPEQAWPMWQALVKESFLDSPGHIPEVLSGAAYRALDVAVPEQTWSSAALLTSTVRGVLGLDPDVPHDKLRFEPHLLPQWTRVTLHNYRVGDRRLALMVEASEQEIRLTVVNDGKPLTLEFAPMISPDRAVSAYVDGRNSTVTVQQTEHDEHAHMVFTVEKTARVRLVVSPK